MKADKGNCFVVLDKCDYDSNMDSLLSDRNTYELISKSPFKRIERELNKRLLALKNEHKISDSNYRKYHQPSVDQSNTTNKEVLLDPLYHPLAQLSIILPSSLQTFCRLYKTAMVSLLLTLLSLLKKSPISTSRTTK